MTNREESILRRLFEKLPDHIKQKVEYRAKEYGVKLINKTPVKCNCGKGKSNALCEYELTGSKANTKCGRLICPGCMIIIDNKKYCRVHAKLTKEKT